MQNHHIMAIKKVILSFIIFFFMLPDAIAKSINSSDWIITEIANFRLISGITNIGSSKLVPLGLEFELERWMEDLLAQSRRCRVPAGN